MKSIVFYAFLVHFLARKRFLLQGPSQKRSRAAGSRAAPAAAAGFGSHAQTAWVDKRSPALSVGCLCRLLNAITDGGLVAAPDNQLQVRNRICPLIFVTTHSQTRTRKQTYLYPAVQPVYCPILMQDAVLTCLQQTVARTYPFECSKLIGVRICFNIYVIVYIVCTLTPFLFVCHRQFSYVIRV